MSDILCSGDCWTAGNKPRARWDKDGDFIDHTFPLWPEILSEKLGMGYTNLGCGGRGNQWIYDRIIDNWNGEKIIFVQWCKFAIWDIGGQTLMMSEIINSMTEDFKQEDQQFTVHRKDIREKRLKIYNTFKELNLTDIWYNLQYNIRIFNAFQNFCELNNIQYIQAVKFGPIFDKISADEQSKIMNLLPRLKRLINEENFIGFPIFKELGGFTLCDILSDIDLNMYRVGETTNSKGKEWFDPGPNHEGHKIIADIYYEKWKELYKKGIDK